MFRKKRLNKKGMELQYLGWWIIALLVIVIVTIGLISLKSESGSIVGYIKDLFKFK